MFVTIPGEDQDKIQLNQIPSKDSVRIIKDSVVVPVLPQISSEILIRAGERLNDPVRRDISPKNTPAFYFSDTTLVCKRNSIADITFSDSSSFIKSVEIPGRNGALLFLTEKSRIKQAEKREILVKHLKGGESIPLPKFHDDWLLLIILATAFLFSLIRINSKNLQSSIRFFLFRGINDSVSRETGGLFHWQSTILNLVSFFIISLFGYYIAAFYDLIPQGISGIVFWLLTLAVIIFSFTLRNAICALTGNLSGQKDVFNEYLVAIYQSYHYSALIIFIFIILISYTILLPAGVFLVAGIVALGLMYLLRIFRLLIIFMNRNISIFYLILYLCALEILPAAIAIRYFTGNV